MYSTRLKHVDKQRFSLSINNKNCLFLNKHYTCLCLVTKGLFSRNCSSNVDWISSCLCLGYRGLPKKTFVGITTRLCYRQKNSPPLTVCLKEKHFIQNIIRDNTNTLTNMFILIFKHPLLTLSNYRY